MKKNRDITNLPTLSTTESMQEDRDSWVLRLALAKYVGSEDGSPFVDRIDSTSCIVNKKMTWLGRRYLISLCLLGITFSSVNL